MGILGCIVAAGWWQAAYPSRGASPTAGGPEASPGVSGREHRDLERGATRARRRAFTQAGTAAMRCTRRTVGVSPQLRLSCRRTGLAQQLDRWPPPWKGASGDVQMARHPELPMDVAAHLSR